MDIKRSVVVVLAAGVGSRMVGITESTSKCIVDLDGITPLEHTLKSFSDAGVKEAIVIVGHHGDKVASHLNQSNHHGMTELNIIYNCDYNYHGCEYSLSLCSNHIDKYETVYITEGDLLLEPNYIKHFVACEDDGDSAVLSRDEHFVDKTRSVVACRFSETRGNVANRFAYDPDHIDVYDHVEVGNEEVVAESLQLWRVSRYSKIVLEKYLKEYRKSCNASTIARNESGLYSINKLICQYPMTLVEVWGEDWLNLNTIEDVEYGKKLPWLNR